MTNELAVTLGADQHLAYDYSDGAFKFEKVTIGLADVRTNKWYYFESSGVMTTGWKKLTVQENNAPALADDEKDLIGKSKYYWFDTSSGSMVTGWKEIDGKWEMFSNSGIWLYTWDGN